jgi:uncharacterized protein (DUF924 family)
VHIQQSMLFWTSLMTAGCGKVFAAHDEPALGAASKGAARKPRHVQTPDAETVVRFWREAGQALWFAKDPAFDQRFRETFLPLHEAAARGELSAWQRTPQGALALLLLLDQFPRNSFRGTPRMYETDALARKVASEAIAAGHDRLVEPALQLFVYMPFAHSEDLADQERSVELVRRLGQPNLGRAEHHRDIVRRFGRFPHRNAILGRTPRPEEQSYLAEGGYSG